MPDVTVHFIFPKRNGTLSKLLKNFRKGTGWPSLGQAPTYDPSLGPRQQGHIKRQPPLYWSGLSFSSPGDLPDPGTEPGSAAWWTDSLPSEPPGKPATHPPPPPRHQESSLPGKWEFQFPETERDDQALSGTVLHLTMCMTLDASTTPTLTVPLLLDISFGYFFLRL